MVIEAPTWKLSPIGTDFPDVDVEFCPVTKPNQGPVFRSMAEHVQGFSTSRGRNRSEEQFQAGTSRTKLDERTRRYDSLNTSGPFYGLLKRNRRHRILARYAGVTYVVDDDFLDEWPLTNDISDTGKFTLAATDRFKLLGNQKITLSAPWDVEVAADRPLVWHKLGDFTAGGIMADSSGNGWTGAYTVGGASATSLLAQSTDAAVTFNGTTDYAQGGANFDNTPAGSSWEMWFKTTQVPAGGTQARIFEINLPGWGLRDVYLDSGGLLVASSGAGNTSTSAVNDGLVHHAVRTGNGQLYIDGVLQVGNTVLATGAQAPPGIWFGGANSLSSTSVFFAGTIDEFALYDRALSAADVLRHYNAGKAGTTGAWGGDTSGTRLGRVFDIGKIPTADRDIDTGNSTLQPQSAISSSLLNYAQTIEETEQGQLYAGIDGALSDDHTFKIVARQRHALLTATRSNTSQATFKDDNTAGGGYPAEVAFSPGGADLANEVTRQRTGGETMVARDQASIDDHGIYTDAKSSLLYADDNQAYDAANFFLSRHADPLPRIIAVVIDPLNDPTNMFPLVLGLEIGSRITVKGMPHAVGSIISQESIIEGIDHDVTNVSWKTTFRLSPAETRQFWVMDDTTLSVLDSTTRVAA